MYKYFLSFLLGGITAFSLPPYNFVFINFITFPIFFLVLINSQKKNNSIWSNFLLGWLFGTGYFFSNIYWIVYALTFEENFKPLIPFALTIIPLFLGSFYGIATSVLLKIKLDKKFSSILIFSLVFAITEFFRGFIFPWNLIVYSLTNLINSLQILSFIGTYSLNLLSITFFLLPLIVIFKKTLASKILFALFLVTILFSNHYYGVWKIKNDNQFYKELNDVKIRIISPKISIDRFFEAGNKDLVIEELIKLSNPDVSKKTIFVFPEGAFAGLNLEGLRYFKKIFLNYFSENHTIIIGINTEKENKIYNSMVVLDNKLNLLSKYNKINLVPFGEFLPFEKLSKKFGLKKITQGYQSFSPGTDRNSIYDINKNISFTPLICYEIIYSGKIKSNLNDNNFIINISEDGWFGNSIGPYQHFSHSIFRSIEEGKNIIRSANNGISAYIDSNGLIIAKLESTQRGVIEVNKFKKNPKTIFSKFGNKIFFYFILFYIILFFLKLKKKEREII